jgi:hypothetical protein
MLDGADHDQENETEDRCGARSGVYRPPRLANDNELGLMRRIDELFTAWPFLGSRRCCGRKGIVSSASGAVADAPNGDRGPRPETQDDEARAGGTRYSRICCAG